MSLSREKKMQHGMKHISLLLTILFFFISGCSTLSRQTEMMEQSETIKISTLELTNRLYLANFRFSDIVENAADEIMKKSDDPLIRQNALSWKMNAVPAVQEAIFQIDPYAALIEISTLSIQMELFFTEGSGHDLFGPWQPIAIDASRKIQKELIEVWKKANQSSELKETNQTALYRWAVANPIENLSFSHRSISDTLVSFYSDVDIGLQESIGGLALGMHDIKERLTFYAATLPKQARWQAEYLINEKLEAAEIEKSLDNFTRITDVIEKSPQMINDLQVSTLAELTKERIAVLESIRKERIAVLEDINRQRFETIKDFETIMTNLSAQVLAQTSDSAQSVIDHFFWRLAQLLLAGGVLAVLVLVLFRYILPPGRNRVN